MIELTVVGGLLVFFVIGFVTYCLIVYNGLVQLKHDVEKAWANIDVLLKQRYDEIPKLIDVCKAYMKYERDLLERITKARTGFMQARDIDSKTNAENELAGAIGRLFAVAENYPDLKANNSFLQIQNRVSVLENQIADRREFFNDSVNAYNVRIHQVPDVFVASMLNYRSKPLLEIPAREREDVKIKF
ncbi:MAG: LemA family protein [Candidatus Omnitrophica bacterium]|nr:LemA family protein [Candidatus Omnitrophota bacterium]